jgi:23S rRNA pseudouridine955/2504/2580 synthase/23S rRNA pseudouridine1911/1915/1917 synthase
MEQKLQWMLRSHGCVVAADDEVVILINKPAGLLVLPDRFNKSLPNLYTLLRNELGEVFVVHRIDKQTSGLILFAKTAAAHAMLNAQFEGRTVEKIYQAIVQGTATEKSGIIDLPLFENESKGTMRVDEKRGKESATEYRVLDRFSGYEHVEARPKTGRLHQIRVHLAAIGLPVVCDKTYGDGTSFYLSQIKPGYKVVGEEKPLLDRTALHAASLSFEHPSTRERIEATAKLPKDMSSVLKYLRKFRAV